MHDLFGQVPVTWPEVCAWLRQVPGIDPASPRAAAYVKHWNVPGKIAAAKLAGQWPAARAEKPPSRAARGNPEKQGEL